MLIFKITLIKKKKKKRIVYSVLFEICTSINVLSKVFTLPSFLWFEASNFQPLEKQYLTECLNQEVIFELKTYQSDYSDYSSDVEFIDEIEDEITDSEGSEYDPEENITPHSKIDDVTKEFENQYRQFFKATFLTLKSKYLIAQFINQNKFNNISLERKYEIIHESSKFTK